MINYEKQYKDLHGAEVETIMYIADKYASVLNESNAGISSDLKTRQSAFDNELKKIADKDFMIVYGMRNNNKRLIRKYRSSQLMRTKSTESFAESITLTAVPIYYLEPNNRILVKDDNTGINGEYIITKITIPLAYNGTTSITATKVIERIY